MSPLVNPPNRGYSDYQRVDNWDGPILDQQTMHTFNAPEQSGVLDVSRYAYIGGSMTATTGTAYSFTANWYADQAASEFVGSRIFVIQASMGHQMQFRLPSIGPWLSMIWTPVTANAIRTNVIQATNRQHPLEIVPVTSILLTKQGVSIPATTTTRYFPTDYYSGPARVWVSGAGIVGFLGVEYLDTTNTWNPIDEMPLAAGDNRGTITTPTGAWRIYVDNTTASAQTVDVVVTPSTTGSV